MIEVLKVEIPNYITHIQLAKARRKKYYTDQSKTIPKKYKTDKYEFSKIGVLTEKSTGLAVLSNPKTAGQPRFKKISGQEIYSGNIHPQIRSKMIREMKEFYAGYFPKTVKIREVCKIRFDIYNIFGEGNYDLDNMSWILVKVIQDVLVNLKILPEDNITVINGYEVGFYPIDRYEDRKLVVTLLVSPEDVYEPMITSETQEILC
jgi:hypothetical protein